MKKKLLILSFLSLACFWINTFAQKLSLEDCFLEEKGAVTQQFIEDQDGFLWLSRFDGFYRFDGKDMDFINPSAIINPNQPVYHSVGGLFQEKNGDYWFAARESGLIIYRVDADSFQQIKTVTLNQKNYSLFVRNIYPDPYDDNRYFLADKNGVWLFDKTGKAYQLIDIKASEFGNLYQGPFETQDVRKVLYDSQRNTLWMASHSGLFSYRFNEEKLYRHAIPKNYRSFMQNKVDYFLLNDLKLKDKELFVSTWGGGLMSLNLEDETWQQYYFEDEPDRKMGCDQIAENHLGQFFIIHERREVASWETGKQFFNSLKTKDQKNVPGGRGVFIDRYGYLWGGHWKKACRYRFDEMPTTQHQAKIYLRAVSIDQKLQMHPMQRWDRQSISLKEDQQSIAFQFRVIYPWRYDSIQYEYRLFGFEKEWQQNQNREWASYTQLPKGEYQFQARYKDPLSQKYIYSGQLKLSVQKKSLFDQYLIYSLFLLIALGSLGFFYYRYLNKKKQQKALAKYEHKLREVQDAALRSQMNPHFLFNSLNSIRYFIVMNDNQKAADYLTKFSRLIRLILENSKKKLVALAEELELLELYIKMEQIRFDQKFDFELKLPTDLDSNQIFIPPMLIQPYLENAILHGINPKEGRGKIELSFQKQSPFLIIQIEDDGIGREKAKQFKKESVFKKKSLGMSITQARLDLSNTDQHKAQVNIIDLYDQNHLPAGTKVIIKIPIF